MDDFQSALGVAASGMRAQSRRIRVISENIANAKSTARTPDGDPYRRKVVLFRNELDKTLGAEVVQVSRIKPDLGDFTVTYEPNHPAANADGYVKYPNVNSLVEFMDMRQAQ
ncbi:MAG: flagellar basal body rod protein FlgC, partial [Pseudomonadota bacterium]